MSGSPVGDVVELSVVIPVYNDSFLLPGHLSVLVPILDFSVGSAWEVLVVDDGSDVAVDPAWLRDAIGERGRVARLDRNLGKGAALVRGVEIARGRAVLLCDADMATDPSILPSFLSALRDGADVVIGDRKGPLAVVRKPQSAIRRLLSLGYIRFAALLTGVVLSDYNCGFKLFRTDVAREVFRGATASRWGIDIEVLARAARRKRRIVEVPVVWTHGEQSSVHVVRDVVGTLVEAVRVWRKLKSVR